MTALDRAFIKAYSRPTRGAASRPSTGIPGRGSSFHRIDGAHPFASRTLTEIAPATAHDESVVDETAVDEHDLAVELLPAPTALPKILPLPAQSTVGDDDWRREPHPAFATVDSRGGDSLEDGSLPGDASSSQTPAAVAPIVERSVAPALALPSENRAPSISAATLRPLSEFTSAAIVPPAVQAQLEVDRFLWPADCDALCARAQAALDGFVSRLLSGAAEGDRRVALVRLGVDVGQTTVALCVARRAAAQSANWVLVDADFAAPQLAGRLGVTAAQGWQDVVTADQRLGEVLITSVEDRVTLAPLGSDSPATEALADLEQAEHVFDQLADSFELVLIDAGADTGEEPGVDELCRAARVDALYLVFDARNTSAAEVARCAADLQARGMRVAGAIANFAAPEGGPTKS